MLKNVMALVHQDYLPFVEIASDAELSSFIRAQICMAHGKEIPKLEGVAEALFKVHVALIGRLEEVRQKRSEDGKFGGAPKGNQNARRGKENKENKVKMEEKTTVVVPKSTQVVSKTTADKPITNTITITNTKKSREENHLLGKPNATTAASLIVVGGDEKVPNEKAVAHPPSDGNFDSNFLANEKAATPRGVWGSAPLSDGNFDSNFLANEGAYGAIIGHLNDRCGTKFKDTTKATQLLINARFREGFTQEDFYEVINKKAFEWKSSPNMSKYLRPETLFGVKFDRYLNESWSNNETKKLNTTQLAALKIIAEAEASGEGGDLIEFSGICSSNIKN